VDSIDGIPPGDRHPTRPIRCAPRRLHGRHHDELNDHLKLLYARATQLYCRSCGAPVPARHAAKASWTNVVRRARATPAIPRLVIAFPVEVPKNFGLAEIKQLLEAQGYTRFQQRIAAAAAKSSQDRLRAGSAESAAAVERRGSGAQGSDKDASTFIRKPKSAEPHPSSLLPHPLPWKYSTALHCADCDIHIPGPAAQPVSFNSSMVACDHLPRLLGGVIGVDFGLVVPDASLTLRGGAVRPGRRRASGSRGTDLVKYAKEARPCRWTRRGAR